VHQPVEEDAAAKGEGNFPPAGLKMRGRLQTKRAQLGRADGKGEGDVPPAGLKMGGRMLEALEHFMKSSRLRKMLPRKVVVFMNTPPQPVALSSPPN